jgi:hypothetical protein
VNAFFIIAMLEPRRPETIGAVSFLPVDIRLETRGDDDRMALMMRELLQR